MMRNFRGSLLIALMLIVAWATTSEACCWRRARSCGYTSYNSCGGYTNGGYYGSSQGYYGGGGYGSWRGLLQPGVSGRIHPARLLRRPARHRVRLRPAGLQPGRSRWAGVRNRGAARPWRRRLRPGALTVHRFSDHPRGAQAWTFGLTRAGVGGSQLMGAAAGYARPAAGDETRTSTSAAGRHSGDDPAIFLGRYWRGLLAAPRCPALVAADRGRAKVG